MTNGGGGIRAIDWNQRIIPALIGLRGESASDEESVSLGPGGMVTFAAPNGALQAPCRFQLDYNLLLRTATVGPGVVFGPKYSADLEGGLTPDDCSKFPIRAHYPFPLDAAAAPRWHDAYREPDQHDLAVGARTDFWIEIRGGWGTCPIGKPAELADENDPESSSVYRVPIVVELQDDELTLSTEDSGDPSHSHEFEIGKDDLVLEQRGPQLAVAYYSVTDG